MSRNIQCSEESDPKGTKRCTAAARSEPWVVLGTDGYNFQNLTRPGIQSLQISMCQ